MKCRYGAAFALAWTLFVMQPHTSPKGETHLYALPGVFTPMKTGLATKHACMKAMADWKNNFFHEAHRQNLEIYGHIEASCNESTVDDSSIPPE